MAFAKQTFAKQTFAKQTFAFIFIFIFVHIIFASSSAAKARSTSPSIIKTISSPSPAVDPDATKGKEFPPSPAVGPAAAKDKEFPPSPTAGPAATEDTGEGLSLPPYPPHKDFGSVAEVVSFVTKCMQAIEEKVTEFGASLKKRKDQPEPSPGTNACYTACDKDMVAAVGAIKKTLESMQNQDLMQANFDVTAVMTHVGTCEACFEGLDGGNPEVKKLHEWVKNVSGEALDALQSQRPRQRG